MKKDHAQIKMDEIEKHIDDTYFARVGDVSDDAVLYYRIHSPVILIELAPQRAVGTTSTLKVIIFWEPFHFEYVKVVKPPDIKKSLMCRNYSWRCGCIHFFS